MRVHHHLGKGVRVGVRWGSDEDLGSAYEMLPGKSGTSGGSAGAGTGTGTQVAVGAGAGAEARAGGAGHWAIVHRSRLSAGLSSRP